MGPDDDDDADDDDGDAGGCDKDYEDDYKNNEDGDNNNNNNNETFVRQRYQTESIVNWAQRRISETSAFQGYLDYRSIVHKLNANFTLCVCLYY